VPGSGERWIQYFDADRRRRREKVGSKSAAKKLVEKRSSDAIEGIKMPVNLRAKAVTFGELAKRALEHSKAEKRSHGHDAYRMPALVDAFGTRVAEDITPDEIQQWLDSKAGAWSKATRNRYLALMKLAYRVAEKGKKIKVNPVREVKEAKEENERVRYLSDAEETSLRAVIAKSYSQHLPEFEIA